MSDGGLVFLAWRHGFYGRGRLSVKDDRIRMSVIGVVAGIGCCLGSDDFSGM